MSDVVLDHEAHHKIDTHEKVCAERYSNLWDAIKDLKEMVRAADATTNTRLTAMSNRLWALVISVCGAAVLGMAALTFHLLTRGRI